MATYTRANAWNHGGTFDNPDLLWYARGVEVMQARAISDPSSWWFFAAIHGQYLQSASLPLYAANGWAAIPGPPTVPIGNTLQTPSSTQYWDQCQHQTWFFAPWHRGYLLALEAQIRADVIKLGGPSTWALPYWDYFGDTTQYKQYNIPPAFTQKTMKDLKPNPLYVAARYGPDGTANDIYVPTLEANKNHKTQYPPVTQDCMCNTVFEGDDTVPEFGGPDTTALGCFWHGGGGGMFGFLEANPHNQVHNYVGGPNMEGLMGDPGLAALDPIFYLHHANIDRMWAAWNEVLGNTNPTDPNWLNGPSACGNAVFAMPMPGPVSWVYTPQQVNSLSQLNYVYESYASIPKCPSAKVQLSQRLAKLGATGAAEKVDEGAAVTIRRSVELFGASQGAVEVKGASTQISVSLDSDVRNKVTKSLAFAEETAAPDRVFLNLENIRGTQNATVLAVYLDAPTGDNPIGHPELLAGSVGLFGLRGASAPGGRHGGQGLSFTLEITKIVDALHLNNRLNHDALKVTIVPSRPLSERVPITIGRISLYRKGL